MANVQIYQLDGVSSNLDNSALLACDITNPDASERATTPKVTRKLSVAELESQVLNDEEYTTELNTTNQTIFGAINEHHSVIGYNYDAYDATTAYSTDDLCIYNNTLYKAKQATTGNLPTNTTYWEQTSIADEINELNIKVGSLIRVVVTNREFTINSLNAHSGNAMNTWDSFTITPPTGYSILAHVNVSISGFAGLNATLDTGGVFMNLSPAYGIFIFNGSNQNVSNVNVTLRLLTLFIKD